LLPVHMHSVTLLLFFCYKSKLIIQNKYTAWKTAFFLFWSPNSESCDAFMQHLMPCKLMDEPHETMLMCVISNLLMVQKSRAESSGRPPPSWLIWYSRLCLATKLVSRCNEHRLSTTWEMSVRSSEILKQSYNLAAWYAAVILTLRAVLF